MTSHCHNVGAFVYGPATAPRQLVQHAELLEAYADGTVTSEREAYLSHFVFGDEMRTHYTANRNSVAGYVGPCGARYLVFDIDRADLGAALADVRKLVVFLSERYYPNLEPDLPIYFSGNKGFHVLLELTHTPPPAVGFHRVCRTLAEAIASGAGITIDTGIYDINRIVRLPNTRHPKTGLYKVLIEHETLFTLNSEGIREAAKRPWGRDLPHAPQKPDQLATDWHEAEAATARQQQTRAEQRAEYETPDARAPKYVMDFLRFGTDEGERHKALFRCAAWMTEQGLKSFPALVRAILGEAGRDVGLATKDVDRQIGCGIEHARKQQRYGDDPRPDPKQDPDAFEQWAIRHEADPLPPGALDFPPQSTEGGPT